MLLAGMVSMSLTMQATPLNRRVIKRIEPLYTVNAMVDVTVVVIVARASGSSRCSCSSGFRNSNSNSSNSSGGGRNEW